MVVEDKIKQVRKLLYEENRLPQAFDVLEEVLLFGFEHKQSDLAALRGIYNKNQADFAQGTGIITREAYLLEYRRILKQAGELLDAIIREERLSKSGNARKGADITRFSCDRREIMKRFWRAFDQREEKEEKLHLYFLAGQTYGQADSLVKRIISDLKDEKQQVKFAGLKQLKPMKIIVDPTDSYDDICYEMRKRFNRKLHPQVKLLSEFAQQIDKSYPGFQSAKYIPVFYKLELQHSCWDRAVLKSIKWFAKQFCAIDKSIKRHFVFFFIISFNGTPKKEKIKKGFLGFGRKKTTEDVVDVYEKIKTIEQVLPDNITVLPPLTKIKASDLNNWYQFYESNEKVREEKVKALIKKLGGGDSWHMSDVEKELAIIVKEYQSLEMGI